MPYFSTMLYNKFLERVVLPLVDTIRGTNYMPELKNWRNNLANLSKERLLLLQENNLRNLLLHATANVPFYKQFAGEFTGNVHEDIKKLPVIKKAC